MIDRLLAPARRLPARRRTEAALGLILIGSVPLAVAMFRERRER